MTTIRDVAKNAGVSPITVSRVVNDADNVNSNTRARVEKVILELGYIPNLAARSLRSKQTFTLALILPDVTSAFWTTVARGVEDAAQGGGYSVFLCNTDENPDKFTKYLNSVIRQRVDGVLVAPYSMDGAQLMQLTEMKIPTVVIDRRVYNWDGDSVYCDSVAGSHAIVQHLISLGHRRIAIISGPTATSTAEDRVTGYCLALQKAGIPIDDRLILRGEYRESSGLALTRELLENGAEPTAIIAANNSIAGGVLEQLKLLGLRVPGDIAVVCFDEMPEMERRFPFLTNVTQPAYDMGVNATQLLLSRINASGSMRSREVILPTRLILRYSCGRFLKSPDARANVNYSLIPDLTEIQLVKPLDDADRELLSTSSFTSHLANTAHRVGPDQVIARSNRELVRKAFSFQRSDRLPLLDNHWLGKAVYGHVLGHAARQAPDGLNILPEDAVKFAQKIGLDAIPCEIFWNLGPVHNVESVDLTARVRHDYPPPSLAAQLGTLENLLTAAEGTGVGVYVRFSSFVQNALNVVSENDLGSALKRHPGLEKLMDLIVKHQSRVMRAICDRFARGLLFVSIRDDALASSRLLADPDLLEGSVLPRLATLIAPAREHGLPIALDGLTPGAAALPGLFEIGFTAVQAPSPKNNNFNQVISDWSGKLVFLGGISSSFVARSSREEIEEHIRQVCTLFSKTPGFVLGNDATLPQNSEFSDENFSNMIGAIQKYGRMKTKVGDLD